jgi:hypothetical protein
MGFVLAALLVVSQTAQAGAGRQGTLVIHSMTDGARVYVDGRLLGKTPLEDPIPLPAGKHKLKATKAGYGTVQLKFTIRPRRKTELQVDLLPYSGLVKFSSNVEGAEVYVDSKLLGQTPLVREVVVGDHAVMIVKDGFNDFEADLNVKAGKKHFIEGVLTPFEDLSPEVLALAKKQREREEREKEEAERRKLEPVVDAEMRSSEAAPAWYADLYKKWWVWAIAGAVVVTAVTVPLATSGGEQSGLHRHDDSPHTIIDIRQ